ncbi:MAG: FAD-dependent monooxygenase [Muribaculaceae bacterium]|nr:FAD-dependent monooxygenase [Muribaculaceae bacterium]
MLHKLSLQTTPDIAYNPDALPAAAARELGISRDRVKRVDLLRRSIDARRRHVVVNITIAVHVDEIETDAALYEPTRFDPVPADAPEAVVVGAGPAGLFAALQLIRRGVRPILLERGKDVDSRRPDMARISREGIVDPDSNYCFGEGGAGAFSDGKLYTRSKKRGPVDTVLHWLCQHGASENILVDVHPHIGTDKLPGVIRAMRETIIRCGGEVHFSTRVEGLIFDKEGKVAGVTDSTGREWRGPVILATGHSARDVYRMLMANNVEMQPKGIAVGVRLEHPQKLIDSIQYHSPQGRGRWLPAAEYSMLTRVDGRAVYSFCMCPGGFIIPAASAPGQLVVNGMSPSNRGTRWANSGMVVEILPEDLPEEYNEYGSLAMMQYQADIEKNFFEASEHTQRAPAQRMTDFVAGRPSHDLPSTSYAPGLIAARIDRLLPESVARRLQEGFRDFGRKARGFLTPDATLIGAETRTSAPVRVPRDAETLRHTGVDGLYPCGEGAGYAGGIVSAAIDGMRCADAVAERLISNRE